MTRIIQIMPKTITNSFLALLLAWLSLAPAYAAAPPVCYPNTPLAELWLENSPLADHAYGDHHLDFDGDGKTDVFSTEPEDGQYRWRFSAGARQPWQNLGRSVVAPADLRFGDFDGFGKTDLFSIGPNHQWRYSSGGVTAWQPLFQDPNQTPLAELRFGDFVGDGKTDVFRIGPDGRWLYSPGAAGAWQDLNSLNMGTPLTSLRFGDFDGDGQTDIFRIGPDGQWQVSPGGAAAWQKLNPLDMETPLTGLRFGDFNGDSLTDAFRRKADGQWQYSPGAAGDWQDLGRSRVELAGLRFGDFDGDGVTDVLSQAPGGRWRVSFGGRTAWRMTVATVEVDGGLLSCLTGASGVGRNSLDPAISADGRKIVFSSDSDFRNEGIQRLQYEIWLYDVAEANLTRITTSGSDRSNRSPTISADGSKIVFESNADFNDEGISKFQKEIWLYDLDARPGQELTRITTASALGRESFDPAISADGRNIVFVSDSEFGNEIIPDNQNEIWLYDRAGGDFTRLTDSGLRRNSYSPTINADGRKIAFVSYADFRDQNIPASQEEIWLYDFDIRPGQELIRVTTASAPDRDSGFPAISVDGSKIVFASDSDFNDEGDIKEGQFEIWLYDLAARGGQHLTRLTRAVAPDRESNSPVISADGRKIVFHSNANLKNEGIAFNQEELWLYDLARGELTRLTNSEPGRHNYSPATSADGSRIVFKSDADFLKLGTPANQDEIWLFEADPTPAPNPTPTPQPNPEGGFTIYLPLVVK